MNAPSTRKTGAIALSAVFAASGVVGLASGSALVAAIVFLALVGMPLFAVMAGATELAWFHASDPEMHHLRFIAPTILDERFAGSPILVTIPLFTFVGYVLAESKAPERLVRASAALFGWMPGGLAIVCIVASAAFTVFTGGSGVTIIAIGGLLYPALRKEGYSEPFSLGIVTTGGSVGLLLPYSLPLLVYSLVAQVDFNLAFKAVLGPGLLVLALLSAYAIYVGIRDRVARQAFDAKVALRAIWEMKWEAGIPLVLVGGIKSGLTQIDECAGLVALYVLCIETRVHKDLSIKKDLLRIAKGSMALAGAVMLILAMANALINYVIHADIPKTVLELLLSRGLDKPWQFLVIMNAFLLVLGMVMDGFSAILVAVPLVLPFAAHFGLNPLHVAFIFILNLELAFSCPPLGLNLFIASFRFSRPVVALYRYATPFVVILGVALLIVSYVPSLSRVLVNGDIEAIRARALALHAPPRDAWKLECVQADPSNPLPCSDADKARWPNGNEVQAAPKGQISDDDALLQQMMGGKPKDAGL